MAAEKKICCFGELLLRFSPEANGGWIRNNAMPVCIGGAELNVATALACWNIPVTYCTALPEQSLSRDILQYLHERGIGTDSILFSGNRTGIYYLPQGADLKHAGVIYDREGSSFASLQPGMIDWDHVLQDCHWFHCTAISPALNGQSAAVLKEGLAAAKSKGLFISIDLNYRAKLWQFGKRPPEVMHGLMHYADMIMGNTWAAEQLLDIPSPVTESKGLSAAALADAACESMLAIHRKYPGVQYMAYTYRLEDTYFALMQQGPELVISGTYSLAGAVEKAGSGDCFMAGLIYGIIQQHAPQDIINFAAAAATGKMKERGDSTRQTIEDINKIMATAWTNRIP